MKKLFTRIVPAVLVSIGIIATPALASAAPKPVVQPGSMIRAEFIEWGCTITNGGYLVPDNADPMRSGSDPWAVMSAGHCFGDEKAVGKPVWGEYSNTEPIGTLVYASNKDIENEPDYAIIRLNKNIGMKVASRSTGTAKVGERVCSKGRIDGYSCGTVTKVGPHFTVVKYDALPIPGNSGSQLYNSKGQPVGLLSRADKAHLWKIAGIPAWSNHAVFENLSWILNDAKRKTGYVTSYTD